MPRTGRLPIESEITHVFCRGNRRQEIYRDAVDRVTFLQRTDRVIDAFEWRCLAYCLMDNHFHLLVETEHPNLSEGMHRLNGGYAQWFNRRHDLSGHVFEDRFRHVAVTTDHQLLLAARYVILNPVRANICAHPADWRWSSYRATAGIEPPERFLSVDALLAHFAPNCVVARGEYREFVREGVALWHETQRAAA